MDATNTTPNSNSSNKSIISADIHKTTLYKVLNKILRVGEKNKKRRREHTDSRINVRRDAVLFHKILKKDIVFYGFSRFRNFFVFKKKKKLIKEIVERLEKE